MESLETRVAKLERENQRLRLAAYCGFPLVLLAIGAIGAAGAEDAKFGIVTAKQVTVGGPGSATVSLTSERDTAALTIRDARQKVRATIALNKDGVMSVLEGRTGSKASSTIVDSSEGAWPRGSVVYEMSRGEEKSPKIRFATIKSDTSEDSAAISIISGKGAAAGFAFLDDELSVDLD